jgi:hypothetical protein
VNSVEALSAAVDARDLMMPAFRAIVRATHDGIMWYVLDGIKTYRGIRGGEIASFRFSNISKWGLKLTLPLSD